MMHFFGFSELIFRFGAFAIVLLTLAGLELLAPRRIPLRPRGERWLTNLTIAGLGGVVVRGLDVLATTVALPLIAFSAAYFANAHQLGLFGVVSLPLLLELIATLVLLDLAMWLQHIASHKIPLLWRLHQVHHVDRDFDVTTGLRFHPVEIGLSMLYKVLCVIVIGASPLAVVIFELALNTAAMFNHANIALPRGFDRILRLLVVTPDMHRVHHSELPHEHESNFGVGLSLWDRMFHTYVVEPEHGHIAMTIGLSAHRSEAPGKLLWSLALPFHSATKKRKRDHPAGPS